MVAPKVFQHLSDLPCFPFVRSAGHIHKRHTPHLKVPFFVGDRFNEEFTGNNLKTVERSVEEDYISNLRNNCWKEKQQSKSFTFPRLACWNMTILKY